MKVCFPAKLTICLRTVLFFGLLGGLLFSSSEGIRLLPFPVSDISQIEWKTDGENNYEENLHRFENRSLNHELKSHQNRQNDWLNIGKLPESAPIFEAGNPFQPELVFQPDAFRSRLFARTGGSRAPPRL